MSSRGFQSSVDLQLHFGLGELQKVDSLIIRWPDQKEEILRNVNVDSTITLDQANAKEIKRPALKVTPPLFKDVTAP